MPITELVMIMRVYLLHKWKKRLRIMQHIQRHSDLQAQQIAECDIKEQQYKIQINKINEQIDNLVNAIAQGSATVIGYLNDKIAALETQRHEIEVALQKHTVTRKHPTTV